MQNPIRTNFLIPGSEMANFKAKIFIAQNIANFAVFNS